MRPILSSPLSTLRGHYDAVVVGSGYGGGIAALRLVEAGKRVAIFERGRDLVGEDFPETLSEALANTRVSGRMAGRAGSIGDRSSLFDLHVGDEMSVLAGVGLGGTSLINASVFLPPDPRFWDDAALPDALRADRAGIEAGLERAREHLAPETWRSARRTRPLEMLAASCAGHVRETPLLVRIGEPRTSEDGVRESSCTGCGNCVTGCRVGAKRTVDRTYVARAHALGAAVFTELDVRAIERTDGGWTVAFRPVVPQMAEDQPEPFVLADIVVVAAGVVGSTAILHRSRTRGLRVSEALGTQVSTNGNLSAVAQGTGARGESQAGRHVEGPGPCITGAVEITGDTLEDGLLVEDGVVPAALATLLTGGAVLHAQRRTLDGGEGGLVGRFAARLRDSAAAVLEQWVEAPRDQQLLLVQGHDCAMGTLGFDVEADDVALSFPHLAERANRERTVHLLERFAEERGGRLDVIALPPSLGGALTVHPLGGCPMGDDALVGVVDHVGRVFDPGDAKGAVHEGLFVLDASILPRSVGTNPVGTLCAVVERACAVAFPATAAGVPSAPPARPTTRARGQGATFSEAFHGWIASPLGERSARDDGFPEPLATPAELRLVVAIDDVDAFLRDPERRASTTGTFTSTALAAAPLSVVGGAIGLFTDDPAERDVYFEIYDLKLVARGGETFDLSALKRFSDGSPTHVLADGTNLPIRVRGGGIDRTGVLQMALSDLARTIVRTRVRGARTPREHLGKTLAFQSYFARRWIERVRGS